MSTVKLLMVRNASVAITKLAGMALVLALCLSSGRFSVYLDSPVEVLLRELMAVCRDSSNQWMIFLCLSLYCSAFIIVQSRRQRAGFWESSNALLWLSGTLVIGATLYAVSYSVGSRSTVFLLWLTGAVIGQAVAVWAIFSRKPCRNVILPFIVTLLLLLLTSSLLDGDTLRSFEYRGRSRAMGLWDNPNTFGLLMGTGMLVALGSAVSSFHFRVSGGDEGCRSWKLIALKCGKWILALLCLLATILMGWGLFQSYSRGAWVAALCGGAYLFWHWINREIRQIQESGPGRGNAPDSAKGFAWVSYSWRILRLVRSWFPVSIILFAAGVLVFWHFRQTEWHPVRRILSVGNRNDFSWRNRVAAWEGTLQMMAEKPWFGYGWNQPEPMYGYYYLPTRLTESAAIQMNDHLALGATLGIPALLCFGMYIWLSLREVPGSKFQAPSQTQTAQPSSIFHHLSSAHWLQATCHAGAIVLLVGFWFDGGLFKLPTASTFWILLELGRVGENAKA